MDTNSLLLASNLNVIFLTSRCGNLLYGNDIQGIIQIFKNLFY